MAGASVQFNVSCAPACGYKGYSLSKIVLKLGSPFDELAHYV